MDEKKPLNTKSLVFLIFFGVLLVFFVVLKVSDWIKSNQSEALNTNQPGNLSVSIFDDKTSGVVGHFSSYQELQSFIAEQQKNSDDYRYTNTTKSFSDGSVSTGIQNLSMESADDLAAPVSSDESANGSGSTDLDFSSSNIQVAGVDEADIIKSDGKYIYAVVGQDVVIVSAYPAEEAKVIKKINFTDSISDIYIQGDKLIVFGTKSEMRIMETGTSGSLVKTGISSVQSEPTNDISIDIDTTDSAKMIWPGNYTNQVFLKVFNISDRTNPVVERDMIIDGSYFNSRLIGDYLYFVVNNYNYNDTILPKVYYQNQEFNYACSDFSQAGCLKPDIYYFDTIYNSFNMTSVFSINISDVSQDFKSSFYLLPSGQNLYVSSDNIYITYTKYLDEYSIESEALLEILTPRLSESDLQTIDEINSISDKILSLNEKKYKIRNILDTYVYSLNSQEQTNLQNDLMTLIKSRHPNLRDELETTVVYKLAILNGVVEPLMEGFVPGHVLNQFSMDEYNTYFRIATTKSRTWSSYIDNASSSNNVYILNDDMETIGQSESLAEGEQIYSVRFIGDRAYVVTYKQIDPLFILDLSNPTDIKVLGELKISGFSNYLHPFGNDILIGFGKETKTEDDRTTTSGLKLSLFDISSDTPQELDSYVISGVGNESIALYDHHAFLASAAKNIIAIPVVLYEDLDNWSKANFNGFLVFEIIDGKIKLKGKISHSTDNLFDYNNFIDYSAKRALYIENSLYSFSNRFIKINSLENLSEVKTVEF